MKIEKNSVASVDYSVKDESGAVIDSSHGGAPMEFLVGAGNVIEGFESALLGLKAGDSKVFSVPNAYGAYDASAIQEVPKGEFSGIDLKEGMTLFGQHEDGASVQVVVKSIGEQSVMIDFNHPLAGKTLEFDVSVLSVREATSEEIARGGVAMGCGCGGHSHGHGGGGCCGGHSHGHSHDDGGCGCGGHSHGHSHDDECCGGAHHEEQGACCGKHH